MLRGCANVEPTLTLTRTLRSVPLVSQIATDPVLAIDGSGRPGPTLPVRVDLGVGDIVERPVLAGLLRRGVAARERHLEAERQEVAVGVAENASARDAVRSFRRAPPFDRVP